MHLATPHAVAAIVAQVAVAVADSDGATVVTGGRVRLEFGELLAADLRAVRCQLARADLPRRYHVVEPLLTPSVGAVALALSDAGVPVSPAIREALQRGLTKLP